MIKLTIGSMGIDKNGVAFESELQEIELTEQEFWDELTEEFNRHKESQKQDVWAVIPTEWMALL